jgi:hypothetical protein
MILFLLLLFCGEISQLGQKYFHKKKTKQHENFVIFRDLFPPFFEMKIIKFSTSTLPLVAGFLYIHNPPPPPPPIFVMELKWPKDSLAKYGIQTRYESKKEFTHPPYFWLPNREICRDFRNLATGKPKKNIIFLASSKKKLATQKTKP